MSTKHRCLDKYFMLVGILKRLHAVARTESSVEVASCPNGQWRRMKVKLQITPKQLTEIWNAVTSELSIEIDCYIMERFIFYCGLYYTQSIFLTYRMDYLDDETTLTAEEEAIRLALCYFKAGNDRALFSSLRPGLYARLRGFGAIRFPVLQPKVYKQKGVEAKYQRVSYNRFIQHPEENPTIVMDEEKLDDNRYLYYNIRVINRDLPKELLSIDLEATDNEPGMTAETPGIAGCLDDIVAQLSEEDLASLPCLPSQPFEGFSPMYQ